MDDASRDGRVGCCVCKPIEDLSAYNFSRQINMMMALLLHTHIKITLFFPLRPLVPTEGVDKRK